MRRFLLVILLTACAVAGRTQDIPKRPEPPRLVNDYTNTLTPDQMATLEQKLVAYDDSTSNQIVIAIVATTNDYDPVDYATKLGREWGVGNKKTNNGVVVLVAKDDHHVFIAPGYGLEGAIPDVTAKSIVDGIIIPNFKHDDFYSGLNLGTDAIIKAATGEYKAPAGYRKIGNNDGAGGAVAFFIVLFIVIIILAIKKGGGGRGGMMSRRGFGDIATGMILGQLLGGGGRSGGDWGGGGGGWGGSSGGGGFGGFGGGSFGGGGAGGSW